MAARHRCGLHCVISDERPVSQVLSCWDVQERRHLAVKVVRAQGVRNLAHIRVRGEIMGSIIIRTG